MLINDVSKHYGISVRTIRYYEEIGLISSSRNPSNIRCYGAIQLECLEEILVYKALNIKLSDIKEILIAKDKGYLKRILLNQLTEIDKGIMDLKYNQQLILSTLETFGSDDFTKDNIKAFVEEQLYFKSSDERWANMIQSHITIDIGEGLIPLALEDSVCSIFRAIKELRLELKEDYGITLDKVRLKDDPKLLKNNEFQITCNNEIYVKKALISDKPSVQVDQIVTHLKALMI